MEIMIAILYAAVIIALFAAGSHALTAFSAGILRTLAGILLLLVIGAIFLPSLAWVLIPAGNILTLAALIVLFLVYRTNRHLLGGHDDIFGDPDRIYLGRDPHTDPRSPLYDPRCDPSSEYYDPRFISHW